MACGDPTLNLATRRCRYRTIVMPSYSYRWCFYLTYLCNICRTELQPVLQPVTVCYSLLQPVTACYSLGYTPDVFGYSLSYTPDVFGYSLSYTPQRVRLQSQLHPRCVWLQRLTAWATWREAVTACVTASFTACYSLSYRQCYNQLQPVLQPITASVTAC